MTLTFRPDMKTIVHEVDGDPITVVGKTIDAGTPALVAMVEAAPGSDKIRVGSKVRCSYVEPSGVHEFRSVVLAVETLALNHRLLRITIAVPSEAERLQRREHVRVCIELPVLVEPAEGEPAACTSVDLSAGGIAVVWPAGLDMVPIGEMVEVRFRSERFEHHHSALFLGAYERGKISVARMRFEGITNAGRDRLATVVFAAQREEVQQQRKRAG